MLTSKVAGAFSIFLTFTVLARVGYNAKEGAVNSAQAIHNLELAYLIGPIVFVMLGRLLHRLQARCEESRRGATPAGRAGRPLRRGADHRQRDGRARQRGGRAANLKFSAPLRRTLNF
uniref:MFS transporter n=1 Tax=Phenylobacterium glaciei TaxID=2803784 RepID=A0A974P672_9CAUL|nr:MFS transporter [Phenylobacterium glaciei]